MYWSEIARILSRYFFAFAFLLLIPLGVSIHYDYFSKDVLFNHSTPAFLLTLAITIGIAGILNLIGKKSRRKLYRKEGLIIVAFIWVLSPIFGALPFSLSHTFDRFSQSYFEATSGLTTAGITIIAPKKYESNSTKEIPIKFSISDIPRKDYTYLGTVRPLRDPYDGKILYEGVEALSKGLLFWRSFMQWVGGIGVVLVFVAILPTMGIGAKILHQAEISGPVKEGVAPLIRQTARVSIWIYGVLTFLQIFLLKITNHSLGFFDAITIAFSTVSTGGFSIKNANLAAYQSSATEWIVIIFMLLGSINFSLYYFLCRNKFRKLKDTELILFIILAVVFCAYVIINISSTTIQLLDGKNLFLSFNDAIRYGCFQTLSFFSTTGFALANYDHWPYSTQMILLICMLIGGMSGSTSGGLKVNRVYLLSGLFKNKLHALFRPDRIHIFHLNHDPVSYQTISFINAFFFVFIGSILVGTFVYSLEGIDLQTALTLTSCMISNVGLGFRAAGPLESVAFLSDFELYFSSFLMIIGRLEFFVILLLFLPSFWKKF